MRRYTLCYSRFVRLRLLSKVPCNKCIQPKEKCPESCKCIKFIKQADCSKCSILQSRNADLSFIWMGHAAVCADEVSVQGISCPGVSGELVPLFRCQDRKYQNVFDWQLGSHVSDWLASHLAASGLRAAWVHLTWGQTEWRVAQCWDNTTYCRSLNKQCTVKPHQGITQRVEPV